jgi:hypothetical protein
MTSVSRPSLDPADEACSVLEAPPRLRSEVGPSAFLDALDFLQRRGVEQLRLLGGDPTRHPDFPWMLTRALERGFSVLVQSSGLISHAVLKKLERLPPEKVTLLLSVLVPGEAWPHELDRQFALFTRLGPRVLPGINLLFPSLKLDFALGWIEHYGLARRVRLELRPYVEGEQQDLARLLAEFVRRASDRGVRLELDSDGVPILDVLPDGKVIACLPLSREALVAEG